MAQCQFRQELNTKYLIKLAEFVSVAEHNFDCVCLIALINAVPLWYGNNLKCSDFLRIFSLQTTQA